MGNLKAEDLATMDVKEMATQEQKQKREKAMDDGFNANRNDWALANAKVVEGMYTRECGSKRTTCFQLQIRGADEPMTS